MTDEQKDRFAEHITDRFVLTILRGSRALLEKRDPAGLPVFDAEHGEWIRAAEARELQYKEATWAS